MLHFPWSHGAWFLSKAVFIYLKLVILIISLTITLTNEDVGGTKACFVCCCDCRGLLCCFSIIAFQWISWMAVLQTNTNSDSESVWATMRLCEAEATQQWSYSCPDLQESLPFIYNLTFFFFLKKTLKNVLVLTPTQHAATSCLSLSSSFTKPLLRFSLCPPGKSRPTISSCLWRSLTCSCRSWWCRSAPSSWSTSTGSTERPSAWCGRRWTSCWPLPPSFTCAASLWTGEAVFLSGFGFGLFQAITTKQTKGDKQTKIYKYIPRYIQFCENILSGID